MVFSPFHQHRTFRLLASTVVGCLIAQTVVPIAAMALTEGPSQPEFSTFQPVSTTEMVNPFTGEFTYNLPLMSVPGPHGSGYPISLSYSSGRSGEDEASWVGKGWTLNTGAIIRNKRGLPDDYHGGDVVYWNKVPKNWTVTAGKKLNLEAFSDEMGDGTPLEPGVMTRTKLAQLGINTVSRYNNRHGFSYVWGLSADVKGMLDMDLGVTVEDGEPSFSPLINPAQIFNALSWNQNEGTNPPQPSFLKKYVNNVIENATRVSLTSAFGLHNLGEETRTTNFPKYTGASYNIDGAIEYNPAFVPVGMELGVSGNYNYQVMEQAERLKGYGYFYSAFAGGDDVMDYFNEHDSPYNKRDLFLSIPYNNADQFSVLGEGIGGGFRAFPRTLSTFGPAHKESSYNIYSLSADVQIGLNYGVGAKGGIGWHRTEAERNTFPQQFLATLGSANLTDRGDSLFFRFNNDMSGEVSYATTTGPVPTLRDLHGSVNNGARVPRSGYIGYSTFQEMNEQPPFQCGGWAGGPNFYRSYNKNKESRDRVSLGDTRLKNAIGEFAIVQNDGRRYVYGLPVFARNETSLQYGIAGVAAPNGRIAYAERDTSSEMVVGEQLRTPYASTYLLTELTSPDYVDRTNDGPSSDDFGGYTLFHYRRMAGANDKSGSSDDGWYKWRSPYNGMTVSRGSLSDPLDDMGAVSYGEKEIYYLESIETKTHIARFILNDSVSAPRRDGYEAVHDESVASASSTATTAESESTLNVLRYLTRIELSAKDSLGQPTKVLQTTHFEYDYSLSENLPNAQPKTGGGRYGSLTLRRLYTEYEGVMSARISPYVFGYEYKKSSDYTALPLHLEDTLYPSIISYADRFDSHPELENPDYSVYNTDVWGHYRYGGRHRDSIANPWVDQTPDTANFDPAAWQLKWIQLPSGGEIHLQYEQGDYRNVQDREVMAMAGLRTQSGTGGNSVTIPDDNIEEVKYYLNLDSLGIPRGSLDAVVDAMKARFLGRGERINFKFLYTLVGSSAPDFDNCTSEYMTGWAKVREIESEGDSLIWMKLGDANGHSLPHQVCEDYVWAQRSGMIDPSGNCNPTHASGYVKEEADPLETFGTMLGSFGNPFNPSDVQCKRLNLDHSYLRVPLFADKKGGGIRVKRLLMFDKGIEAGAAGLYGTEYEYRLAEGPSSGVATNEPSGARDENPIVACLDKRVPQNWYNRIISGRDREQFEGPIGEGVLPGASVGYSRTVVRSIYRGKSNSGFSVYEYNTAREYPFDMPYTEGSIDRQSIEKSAIEERGLDNAQVPIGPVQINSDVFERAQGYSFMVNAMHGRIRSQATYAGLTTSNGGQVSRQVYTYFKPGEKIPVMRSLGNIQHEYLGREMDVTIEDRAVHDVTNDFAIESDFSVPAIPFPWAWITMLPQYSYTNNGLVTHVTTKVIRYPAVVKSVESFRDGNTSLVENIAFDPISGQALVTRSTDGYNTLKVAGDTTARNGTYYSYSIPAYTQYPAMGQISGNQRTILASTNGLSIQKVYADRHSLVLQFSGTRSPSGVMGYFSSGDLVRVYSAAGTLGVFNIGAIRGNQIELLPVYYCTLNTEAVVPNVAVEIIRSGRRNQLTASVGSFTTYGTPAVLKRHAAE